MDSVALSLVAFTAAATVGASSARRDGQRSRIVEHHFHTG
jgi:hypothetical protein